MKHNLGKGILYTIIQCRSKANTADTMKNLLREHKRTLILSSIITLLPLFAGLCLWNILPDVLVAHWNIHGEPDGYMSKAALIFGLPLFMLAMHWFCVLMVSLEKKNRDNSQLIKVMLWVVPIISVICGAVIYAFACGILLNVGFIITAAAGLLLAAVGFYLPRCKQNRTMGIRLPWTLASEENWEKTHRMAGAVWVAGGLLITVTSPLANMFVMLGILLVMILIPAVYSFRYAKTEVQ